jgi:hypothetical protein
LLQALAAANYQAILDEKNKSIELYKKHAFIPGEEKLSGGEQGTSQQFRLQMLRTHIDKLNGESQEKLNLLLLDEFSQRLGYQIRGSSVNWKIKEARYNCKGYCSVEAFHMGLSL